MGDKNKRPAGLRAKKPAAFLRKARHRVIPNKLLGTSIRCFGYAVKFSTLVLAVLAKKEWVKQAAFPLVDRPQALPAAFGMPGRPCGPRAALQRGRVPL